MKKSLLGTRQMTQVGLLVHDIERTAQEYADFLGVEMPEIIITNEYDQALTTYMDKPTEARAKLAFFKVGEHLQIELIEPDQEPSTWRHDLDAYGEGVHHIAFAVNDMDSKIRALEKDGKPLLQKAEITGGRYAYFDARKDMKLILELVEKDDQRESGEE